MLTPTQLAAESNALTVLPRYTHYFRDVVQRDSVSGRTLQCRARYFTQTYGMTKKFQQNFEAFVETVSKVCSIIYIFHYLHIC